jgi:hypothetical protein
VRVLFGSDTHLEFDLPRRPSVVRWRRGDDFFQNVERALEPEQLRATSEANWLRYSRQGRQMAVGVRQHERLDLGSA